MKSDGPSVANAAAAVIQSPHLRFCFMVIFLLTLLQMQVKAQGDKLGTVTI